MKRIERSKGVIFATGFEANWATIDTLRKNSDKIKFFLKKGKIKNNKVQGKYYRIANFL